VPISFRFSNAILVALPKIIGLPPQMHAPPSRVLGEEVEVRLLGRIHGVVGGHEELLEIISDGGEEPYGDGLVGLAPLPIDKVGVGFVLHMITSIVSGEGKRMMVRHLR
jgi:hypothetical protein